VLGIEFASNRPSCFTTLKCAKLAALSHDRERSAACIPTSGGASRARCGLGERSGRSESLAKEATGAAHATTQQPVRAPWVRLHAAACRKVLHSVVGGGPRRTLSVAVAALAVVGEPAFAIVRTGRSRSGRRRRRGQLAGCARRVAAVVIRRRIGTAGRIFGRAALAFRIAIRRLWLDRTDVRLEGFVTARWKAGTSPAFGHAQPLARRRKRCASKRHEHAAH
jgi:hypothetical protein